MAAENQSSKCGFSMAAAATDRSVGRRITEMESGTIDDRLTPYRAIKPNRWVQRFMTTNCGGGSIEVHLFAR